MLASGYVFAGLLWQGLLEQLLLCLRSARVHNPPHKLRNNAIEGLFNDSATDAMFIVLVLSESMKKSRSRLKII